MKKMKSLLLACVAIALTVTACQKDTAPQQSNVTKEKLVGTYKITSMKLKGTDGTEADLLATMPDCERNSTQALNANFSWSHNNACDPADSQTGTWAYVDTKSVVINGLLCNIASFDGTHLVLSFKDFMGMPGTLTEILTKQ